MAPSYIWADSTKGYFAYLAAKRGIDPQQVYDEAAATALGERLLDATPQVRHAVVAAVPYLDRYLDRVPDGAGTAAFVAAYNARARGAEPQAS